MRQQQPRRSQPRVKGGREQLPSAVPGDIKEAVRREAVKFNCSRSWVTAERVANSFGIKLAFSYRSKR